jgi:hypothetical protein
MPCSAHHGGQSSARAGTYHLAACASGEPTISRTKFGVVRDEWRDTKTVGDEVGLKIEIFARCNNWNSSIATTIVQRGRLSMPMPFT